MRDAKALTWLSSALMLGGAAFLGWYYWTLHEAATAQRLAKQWLNRTPVRGRSTSLAVRHENVVRRGDVIGELDIPRLKISVMVFEGDDTKILKIGAGHIPGTALPQGRGNIGIAAHRDTYFRPLQAVHSNDRIDLRTPAGTSHYSVTTTEIVRPSDIGVLARARGSDLTLVTCYPFYYVGSAPQRFIVHARKIE
jgi:LPXTG-site transpeptidase (sortase) family protein